jgi:hypothetical protein
MSINFPTWILVGLIILGVLGLATGIVADNWLDAFLGGIAVGVGGTALRIKYRK